MGHNMDTDARDLFIRLEHYFFLDWLLGVDYNRQERFVHFDVTEDINRIDLDVTWQKTDSLRVQAAYRYESIDNLNQIQGNDQDNHIFRLFVDYSF